MGNAALGLGVSWTELCEMPWGRVVLMLQARARTYARDKREETRQATWGEIKAFHGG